jgi:Kazal-type serine protease inhibitor-like protein
MNPRAWNFTKTSPLVLAALLAPTLLGARGCTTAVVGSECGGLQGISCGPTLFCDFAADAACGAADQTGTCRERPDACAEIFAPVCGCDDQNYENACAANRAGVSVASTGDCDDDGEPAGDICGGLLGASCSPGEFCNFGPGDFCGAADATGICTPIPEVCTDIFQPVCGCDDQTYGNACEANAAGISVVSEGECASDPGTEPRACAGLTGLQCADDEFCSFAPDAICGAADQTGVCQPKPEACIEIFQPVCGCDDRTYGNSCEANSAGVSVASEGACAGDPGSGTVCGGFRPGPLVECPAGEFCRFALGDICGFADATGICSAPPEACDAVLAPVCGCDGRTYDNECEANVAGTSAAASGECEPDPNQRICGGLLGAQCEDGEFCDFAPGDFCGAADATGICRPTPEVCADIFSPVCGCDGETHPNACEANAAGTSVVSSGPCE